jgi:magnesium transporter
MADPAVVNCAAYEAGRRVADISIPDISEALKVPGRFVWVGLYEPDDALLREIQQEFELHDLAVEDALRAHQRPKVEQFGDSLFVVLRTAVMTGTPPEIALGETHLFVGPRFVVSVRHGPSLPYTQVRARCESAPQLLARGPGFVLYAIMDFIVDQYFPIVDALEESLEGLEESIFGGPFNKQTMERIYLLKRDLLTLKRAISPVMDVCNRLMRFDLPLIPADTQPYIRDVYDHAVRLNEMVDTLRELLSSALEANLSLISVEQNESMKRLAGWAAIIAVPTMIAGIYGMNFKFMPELNSPFGYPVALLSMAVACGYLYIRFRRAGWL